MNLKDYKPYIISFAVIAAVCVVFYFLGQIVLPFFLGLALAYLMNPLVRKFQKFIPNRNLAVSTLLLISAVITIAIGVIFGSAIINDFKRLNGAFVTFAEENSEQIDETNEQIKSYIEHVYNSDAVQEQIAQNPTEEDSTSTSSMKDLKSAFSAVSSFLGTGDKNEMEQNGYGLNWVVVLFSTLGYFLYIIYTYTYFEDKFKKYFDDEFKKKSSVHQFIQDFKRIFMQYFRQRTKVVILSMLIFVSSFLIINVPGALLIGILAGFLCYIAHFHYVALIPLSLSCWVLSMETDTNFFVFFGIIIAVFILVSVLEELVFNPKIMGAFSGMNPAIMLVSFAVWIHLFGPTFGTLIALPLTAVFLIYLDRILLYIKDNIN